MKKKGLFLSFLKGLKHIRLPTLLQSLSTAASRESNGRGVPVHPCIAMETQPDYNFCSHKFPQIQGGFKSVANLLFCLKERDTEKSFLTSIITLIETESRQFQTHCSDLHKSIWMHFKLAPVGKKKSKHVPHNSLKNTRANSCQILPCFIQGLHRGAVSNPAAAQRWAFSKTCTVQGAPTGITNNISLQKAEFTLLAVRLWHTSILHPLNSRDKMKRILWLVIAFLNEGALSLPEPCVVTVSVVTTDCTEKEVSVNCWHVNNSYLWVWFIYIHLFWLDLRSFSTR